MPLVERAARVGQAPIPPCPCCTASDLACQHFRGAIEPAVLLVAFVVVILFLSAFGRGLANRKARRVDAWGCGRDVQTLSNAVHRDVVRRTTSTGLFDVLRPQTDVEVTHVAESRYYEQSLRYRNRVSDALEQHGYRPLIDATLFIGRAARRLQNGSVHRYLAFGFVALLVVLVVLA